LFVFGGWNGRAGLNDLHVLNVDEMEWSIPGKAASGGGAAGGASGGSGPATAAVAGSGTSAMISGPTPSTRNNHATFVYNGKLYVHGGHDGVRWLADLHCLDTEKMEWSQPAVSGVLPSARACHTTTLLGRKVYMFGGEFAAQS
jgi:hypothetical protein